MISDPFLGPRSRAHRSSPAASSRARHGALIVLWAGFGARSSHPREPAPSTPRGLPLRGRAVVRLPAPTACLRGSPLGHERQPAPRRPPLHVLGYFAHLTPPSAALLRFALPPSQGLPYARRV